MGVKGFPTLKTVRPTGKLGKPIILDYNGERTATAIVEAVKALIPNVVKRIDDKGLNGWLSENNSTAKAILFSDKGTTSALIKVLANEYAGNMHFAQIRNKEEKAVSTFGITNYPTLLVLPGGEASAVVYDGELKKPAMNAFLSEYAELRKGVAPEKGKDKKPTKKDTKKDKKAESSDSSKFSKASASHASEDATEAAAGATTITLEEPGATESPDPIVNEDAPKPIVVPEVAPPLPSLETQEDVQAHCLGPKTPTCVLALLPAQGDAAELSVNALAASSSLAELAQKHKARGGNLFPFYTVPAANVAAQAVRLALGLAKDEVELLAVNGKRAWWRHYDSSKGFGAIAVENWVDGIRFGEGKKQKLPEGLVVDTPVQAKPAEESPAAEKPVEEEKKAEDKPPVLHEEL